MGALYLLKSLYEDKMEMKAQIATTTNVMITEAVALLQNFPNDPQAELQVISVSPLQAKYNTSVDTVPAARVKYVSSCVSIEMRGT